ncbi:MAG: PCRF domain-containing protein [Candidatus Pacebacteria bacterium]|nr:PCRF domain-containing protein [Candidatus Paceibacterota bacterium]
MERNLKKELEILEKEMLKADFWQDKKRAQAVIKEIELKKDEIEGKEKYDRGGAVMTIFSGAGGLDAEDFSRILFQMYKKFIENRSWQTRLLHKNENEHKGFRNITFEIIGANAYGILKNESGVHRLVRLSPFNANQKRHTSFSMVEVIPKFKKTDRVEIKEEDLKIEFSRSSGPGGQNVNKRDTAARITHLPTNISAHIDSERTQAQNKEKALEILRGKLYKKQEEERLAKEAGKKISKTMSIEWGNQIRSYVFHPYQMVKDHRSGVEMRDIDKVIKGGELEELIYKKRSDHLKKSDLNCSKAKQSA